MLQQRERQLREDVDKLEQDKQDRQDKKDKKDKQAVLAKATGESTRAAAAAPRPQRPVPRGLSPEARPHHQRLQLEDEGDTCPGSSSSLKELLSFQGFISVAAKLTASVCPSRLQGGAEAGGHGCCSAEGCICRHPAAEGPGEPPDLCSAQAPPTPGPSHPSAVLLGRTDEAGHL